MKGKTTEVREEMKRVLADSEGHRERSDCAVRAVALATGLGYATVHEAFAIRGRRRGRGTPWGMTRQVLADLGFKITRAESKARTVRTFARVAEKEKKYLVGISGHLLAVIAGIATDWTAGRCHRIRRIYVVARIS